MMYIADELAGAAGMISTGAGGATGAMPPAEAVVAIPASASAQKSFFMIPPRKWIDDVGRA